MMTMVGSGSAEARAATASMHAVVALPRKEAIIAKQQTNLRRSPLVAWPWAGRREYSGRSPKQRVFIGAGQDRQDKRTKFLTSRHHCCSSRGSPLTRTHPIFPQASRALCGAPLTACLRSEYRRLSSWATTPSRSLRDWRQIRPPPLCAACSLPHPSSREPALFLTYDTSSNV